MPYLVKIGDWYVCRGSLPQGCGKLHLSKDVGRARIYTHKRHADTAKAAIVTGRRDGIKVGRRIWVSTPHTMYYEPVPDGPVQVIEIGITEEP